MAAQMRPNVYRELVSKDRPTASSYNPPPSPVGVESSSLRDLKELLWSSVFSRDPCNDPVLGPRLSMFVSVPAVTPRYNYEGHRRDQVPFQRREALESFFELRVIVNCMYLFMFHTKYTGTHAHIPVHISPVE